MQAVIQEADLRNVLGDNVERLRKSLDLTQEALAKAVGLHRVALNRIEQGRATPKAHIVYRLADALGVTADSLRQIS
jgi:transcriptional regulator with XRE-family HTH domain